MSNVKKPEPVAWVSHVTLKTLASGKSITAYPTETPWLADGLITTDQAEAYKDACVREALEQAAKKPREYALQLDKNGWGNRFPDELTAIFNAADNMADQIRALIPKQ